MKEKVAESRKLLGLALVLLALLLLATLAVVAVTLFDVGESLFAQIATVMGALGIGHQTAQAAADRSPYYPNASGGPFDAPGAAGAPTPPVDGMRL